MVVLILGARGQFGTALEARCVARNIAYLSPPHAVADITDGLALASYVDAVQPSVIVNAAGFIDFPGCERDPKRAFAINTTAVRGLANICKKRNLPLVQTSTHLIFSGNKNTPYTEKDMPQPNSIYAASKFVGETIALTRNPQSYIVRFSTLFGSRRNCRLGFIERMTQHLKNNEPLAISADRVDSPTWAIDAADQVLNIVREKWPFGVYHVANSGHASYFETIRYLANLVNSKSSLSAARETDFQSDPPKPLKVAITSIKLRPIRGWKEALSAYVSTI